MHEPSADQSSSGGQSRSTVTLMTPLEDECNNYPDLTFRSVVGEVTNAGSCTACRFKVSLPPEEDPQVTRLWHKLDIRFLCSSVVLCVLLGFLALLLVWGKEYVRDCLVWMDSQEEWIVCLVFLLLYTAVSFPVTWGYILLNLACGYHFGIIVGVIATSLGACVGIFIAHLTIKWYFVACAVTRITKIEAFQAILAIIEGPHGFKLLVISRLMPIPFGLQNALFALSNIGTCNYIIASAIGLLPTQIINVYLGTTVRSIESILADDTTAAKGYAFLAAQVILSFVLMVLILRKAKQELKKTLQAELRADEPIAPMNQVAPKKRKWLQFRNKLEGTKLRMAESEGSKISMFLGLGNVTHKTDIV